MQEGPVLECRMGTISAQTSLAAASGKQDAATSLGHYTRQPCASEGSHRRCQAKAPQPSWR